MRVTYARLGCASLCPADRLTIDRNGRLQYDGERNVPRLGHFDGRADVATVVRAFAALERAPDRAPASRVVGPDAQRIAVSVRRRGTDEAPVLHDGDAPADALHALDDVRDGARFVATAWEDPYLGYYARESGPETLDVLTIEDVSFGRPIAYLRTSHVDPCSPRGLSDRAVGRGRLVRVGANVRYEPERSEFDPAARPVPLRLVRGGLALRGDVRDRIYVRLSQGAYLARLDRFQTSVDAQHGAQCTTQ